MVKDKYGNTLRDIQASERYLAGSLALVPVDSPDYNVFLPLLMNLRKKLEDFPNGD